MAKLKRYELYGDGETIPGEYTGPKGSGDNSLPGKMPYGRAEEARKPEQPAPRRQRYFASNEDDGLGAPSTLFDDFDRFNGNPDEPEWRPPRKQTKNRGAWAAVIVMCLIILTGIGVLMFPQLTGIPYKFLPTIGFANGNVLTQEPQQDEAIDEWRKLLYSDRIYPGVFIDNVDVGGMTREEAIRAVEAVNVKTDTTFDIIVSIGNESWHVNSERVPISRNTSEIVEKAYAAGRGNSTNLQGGSMTPFQERINQASSLQSNPVSFTTKQDYDHKALRAMTDGIVQYVNCDPVNSMVETFNFTTKKFTFTEDQPGARIDPDELYERLTTLLDNGVMATTIRVTPEKVLAEMTKAELMNRFGLISAYTTSTTNNKNRNKNIELSAQAINGITVQPGETFSFNQATGERTAAKGYKEAAAISGGTTRDEIGGGVCQTSSTLFNAAVRANMEIVERNPHAWPSSYIEKGFDATVNWPGLDMKFKNSTNWPIFIVAGYSNRKITVNIYGMSLGADMKIDLESKTVKTIDQPSGTNYVINSSLAPGESKKTVTGRPGYVVETWKIWYQGNRVVKEELLYTTTYKAYQETVEYNPQ